MKNQHLRELDSIAFAPQRVTEQFSSYVVEQLIPDLDILSGYKRQAKRDVAVQLICNLVLAGQRSKTINDSRDHHETRTRIRNPIWDALVQFGYAIYCKGTEASGKRSRYYAKRKLLKHFKNWNLNQIVHTHFEKESAMKPTPLSLVLKRPSKKDINPMTGELFTKEERKSIALPFIQDYHAWVEQNEDIIDFINRRNVSHSWMAFTEDERGRERAFQVSVNLQQQHCGSFMRMKRLYTPGTFGGQQLSKECRRTMLIDGEPVVELDYRCSLLRILYHLADRKADAKDLYKPRKVIPNLSGAKLAIRKLGRKVVKQASIMALMCKGEKRTSNALQNWVSKHPKRQAIKEIAGAAKEVVARLAKVHKPVAPWLFRDIGLTLISLESTIMQNICLELALRGTPVLPIHDAVVVRERDTVLAERLMLNEYRQLMNAEPVVKLTA